jgi:hypothetical protein
MKTLARYALSVGATAALLVGCGPLPLSSSKGQDDMQLPIGAPGAVPQGTRIANRLVPAPSYRVLFRFHAPHNGGNPFAGLINVNGKTVWHDVRRWHTWKCRGA